MDWINQKLGTVKNALNSTLGKLPIINNKLTVSDVPFEMHLPGYQFCGPGTKFGERIARGETGVNALDNACMKHDAVYNTSMDKTDANRARRAQADDELINAARDFRKNSSSFKDKAAAAATEAAMRTKKFFKIF